MAIYRLTIEPHGSFRTPLQSDTIFGHLLWAWRYTAKTEGEPALAGLLDRYRTEEPPFLVSAGFPEDTLPAPVLAEPATPPKASIANQVVADLLRKVAGELDYLPLESWRNLAPALSAEKLQTERESVRRDMQDKKLPDYRHWQKDRPITRTAIDRITGSAREGQLFVAEETFYGRLDNFEYRPARFDIWHKLTDEKLLPRLIESWQWIEHNGFGKRKSTGHGAFRIIGTLEPADDVLPQVDRPNAFVSLSAWVPKRGDPTQVTYRTRVKRGKLAEQYALPSPWKKPLLMLEPGAVARLAAGEPLREWYGGLVEDMHWTKEGIVQYGFAFPVGVNVVGS